MCKKVVLLSLIIVFSVSIGESQINIELRSYQVKTYTVEDSGGRIRQVPKVSLMYIVNYLLGRTKPVSELSKYLVSGKISSSVKGIPSTPIANSKYLFPSFL